VASAARQTGTTLGVAIAGTIVGSAAAGNSQDLNSTSLTAGGADEQWHLGALAFTHAEHHLWWPVMGLGIGLVALALLSTTRWAHATAQRTAELFNRPAATPEGRSG
jgi:hypothetical protein